MMWQYIIYFAVLAALLMIAGAVSAFGRHRRAAVAFSLLGAMVLAVYIAGLWIGTSAYANYGRDASVVFFLPVGGRCSSLCEVAVSLGAVIYNAAIHRFSVCEYI